MILTEPSSNNMNHLETHNGNMHRNIFLTNLEYIPILMYSVI